jgi:GTPase SAR1 family protein
MAEYDFSTLNGTDLEDLACDLLNADQPSESTIKYKTFKEGQDKGIDFLYSTKFNIHAHVGQVKHYLGSGYSGLLSTLKNSELKKVKILKPDKYIVATSVDLSVANTEEIQKVFKPFIKSLNDIYGKKDLNRLIKAYPKVHTSHFKLWFSDTTVFQKLLNSNLEFRSVDFIENEIKKRLRIYVETKALQEARESLRKNKYIVITGEPGVGKTTLAEILAYEYIKDDYELTYIYDSIKDADSSLIPDDSKQVLYFDDFLGSNKVEINKARGSDTILNKVLRRVKNGNNKILIFTTRKHILNNALQESEKLKRSNLLKGESMLHLDDYPADIRNDLLRNHIDDSELTDDYKELLSSLDIFKFIVEHKHFSPRSVEFITNVDTVGTTLISDFEKFVKESFDNPIDIWKHAYTNQLDEDDRLLLNTLLSFGDEIEIDRLKLAFEARIEYEVLKNNKQNKMFAFNRSYEKLLGGFIYANKYEDVRFINPSLTDFLLKYIRTDKVEVEKIASSVIDVAQLTKRLFAISYSDKKPIMPMVLQERLLHSYESFLYWDDDYAELIKIVLVIYKYIDSKEKEKVICEILGNIDDWEEIFGDYELNRAFSEFMLTVKDNDVINTLIQEKINVIINGLVISNSDIDEAYQTLSEVINRYDLDLEHLNTEILENHFCEILSEEAYNEVDWLKESIMDESEAHELRGKTEVKIKKLADLGLDVKFDYSMFTDEDWWEIAMENDTRRLMEADD